MLDDGLLDAGTETFGIESGNANWQRWLRSTTAERQYRAFALRPDVSSAESALEHGLAGHNLENAVAAIAAARIGQTSRFAHGCRGACPVLTRVKRRLERTATVE